ncbi:cache domain-containing sensor histidine kinase [Paenibacillus humicola]|uniref:cache domain-containing sensor histidine kinase n=1 Tax=Paenibacillus humicola TaxID=3110540 RepID=UPI00237C0CB9|nr:sensor histidine kinase [Paenibacillus humicola]
MRNPIRTFLQRLSLRRKIKISIVVCLIAPPIIAIQVSNYFTRDVMREQAATYARESLDAANLFTTDLINSMIYITNNIQFDSETTSLLKRLGKKPVDETALVIDGQKVTNKLEAVVLSKDHIYVSIVLPNGEFFTNYSVADFNPLRFQSEPWFRKLDSLNDYDIYWVGAHPTYLAYRQKDSPYMITMARALRAGAPKPYAYLVVSVEERPIQNFFNKYASSQRMVLMDAKGRIMASPDNKQVGSPFEYFSSLAGDGEARFLMLDRQQYMLLSEPLPFSGWRVASLVPYENAIGKIQRIREYDYMFQFAFLLIFIVFLFWLVSRIMKPMLALAKVAASVKTGMLGVRTNIRGADEAGRLGQVFDQMLDRIEAMIRQITEEQARKRKVELELLQAQINPHFLFNLLNSIRLKIQMKGDRESADIIASLSRLLRMTINRNNEFLPVHQEVETAQHYVKLMNVRHNQKIQFETHVASDAMLEHIPRFTFQPLVENAFIHGLKQKHGRVELSVWKENGELVISVKDDGGGMEEDTLAAIRDRFGRDPERDRPEDAKGGITGIGLKNVHERLAMIYGSRFRMTVDSRLRQGTEIQLHIPTNAGGEAGHVQGSAR